MNGLENSTYVVMLLVSNLVALILLLTAWKYPRLARLLFSILFMWAGWMNWITVLNDPGSYLNYANLAILNFYSTFINGWFREHTLLAVGIIASCQIMISIGMQARGRLFRAAAVGAIVFFLAILPLGVGSGFPCTLIMAIAMYQLLRHAPTSYLWISEKKSIVQKHDLVS